MKSLYSLMKQILVFFALVASARAWIFTAGRRVSVLQRRQPHLAFMQSASRNGHDDAPSIQGVASSGLDQQETPQLLYELTELCTSNDIAIDWSSLERLPAISPLPGATGRCILLQSTGLDEEMRSELQIALSQQVDELLFDESSAVQQPVLVAVVADDETMDNATARIASIIESTISEYDLAASFECAETVQPALPAVDVRLDGAWTEHPETAESFWDTSAVVVFDGLVDDELRSSLLDVVLGGSAWDWESHGPDPSRWQRCNLGDVPDGGTANNGGVGLTAEAIGEICLQSHDALKEFESLLAGIFPQFATCRMPEGVFGPSVSPLTANAPVCGDEFAYHIDGDPYTTPPSPWTDVFGRYPNRIHGKPRMMSCLVYLNDEWKPEWGASTRFLDVASSTTYDVEPRPGRVLLMDQDVTHTVTAPTAAAGARPRYSLVWKLLVHPRVFGQNMMSLDLSNEWPATLMVGSAKR